MRKARLRMNRCPMFIAVKKARKSNCGNCGRWDKERQKCRDEERLRELK